MRLDVRVMRFAAAAVCCFALAASGFSQQISGVSITPNPVASESTAKGTVTLNKAAGSAGLTVKLVSSSSSAASVPTSVKVSSGAKTATFTVESGLVKVATKVTITGTDTANKTAKASLTVNPPPHLTSITVSPNAVPATQSTTGTVTLTAVAPSGGLQVKLSTKQSYISVPSSVTVAAGSKTAKFTIGTSYVAAKESATISGADTYGFAATGSMSVEIAAVRVTAVSIAPTTVVAANAAKGTVTLSAAAPSAGFVVDLSSAQSFVSVPSSVKVLSGAKTATFTLLTHPVTSAGAATITAKDTLGYSASGKVTVTIPAVHLTTLTLSPTSVFAGTSSTGTVTLSGVAPKAGVVINLSTMATAAVTIPLTVKVASGAKTATFTITTKTVTSTVAAAINATDPNDYPATANLNVNPIVGIAMTDARTYVPQTYTAAAGSTVTWTNTSFMGHTVTADIAIAGFVSGNVDSGGTFSWTIPANAASGTKYYYHCDYHAVAGNGTTFGTGMVGVIIVK